MSRGNSPKSEAQPLTFEPHLSVGRSVIYGTLSRSEKGSGAKRGEARGGKGNATPADPATRGGGSTAAALHCSAVLRSVVVVLPGGVVVVVVAAAGMNEAPGRGGARAASAALGGFARAGRAGRAGWPGLSARTKPLCCVRPHEKGAAGRSPAPHRYSNFYNYFVVHYSATALGALSVKIDAVSAAAAAAGGQRLKAIPGKRGAVI